jgi:uncharacterized protein (DUF1810 family)
VGGTQDLDRFRQAQDAVHAGFATALAELRAGRKRSHWIWYVFPQLAGLGQSSTAAYFAIANADEAAAYLRDDTLGERLVQVCAVVRGHLTGKDRVHLETLMGSGIDALKLVSSMTLFATTAKRLFAAEPRPRFATMADHAAAILTVAATQGYPRCAFTEASL